MLIEWSWLQLVPWGHIFGLDSIAAVWYLHPPLINRLLNDTGIYLKQVDVDGGSLTNQGGHDEKQIILLTCDRLTCQLCKSNCDSVQIRMSSLIEKNFCSKPLMYKESNMFHPIKLLEYILITHIMIFLL